MQKCQIKCFQQAGKKLNDSPASKTNAPTPSMGFPWKQLPSRFAHILGRMLNGFWNARPFTDFLVRKDNNTN